MNQGLLGLPKPYGPLFCYKKWDPYAPDDNPHSLSCEFDDPSDVARFTRVNIDGVSELEYDSAVSMGKGLRLLVPNLQYRWRSFLRPLPADPTHTIFCGIDVGNDGGGSLLSGGGICYSTTATTNTGSQRGNYIGTSGSQVFQRFQVSWSNFGETATGAASVDHGRHPCRHLAWKWKGGNDYFVGFSVDGITYYWYAQTSGGLGFTPAYVGLWGINYSGNGLGSGNEHTIGFHHFRYYPTSNIKKSGRLVNVYR